MADDEVFTEPGDEQARDRVEGRGTGISKWSLAALGVAILLVIILAQNTESVDVDVLWTSFDAPLFLVVLIAGAGADRDLGARDPRAAAPSTQPALNPQP